MGDDVNAFDLPSRLQSGNGDSHQSTIVEPDEEAVRNKAQHDLDEISEDFFSGQGDTPDMIASINDLGYSDRRRTTLIRALTQENIYRQQHNGTPSGLSYNQLQYIASQNHFDTATINILVDENNRIYIEDDRTREDDGTPSKLYLPTATEFNPITRTQMGELQYEQSIVDDITIQDPDISDISNHLLVDDISQANVNAVSQIVTQYLQGNRNEQDRDTMRHTIQTLPGLSNTINIREKLIVLFDDINQEEQYRVDNDGRPRNLSDEEWNYIQDNSDTLNYYGQPILETRTDPPTKYFFTGTGYTVVYPDFIRNQPNTQLTQSQQRQINLFTMGYMTGEDGDTNPNSLSGNLSSLFDDPDFSTRLQIEDIAQKAEAERVFRSLNNGRPSQLTPLQYQFLLNHTLQDGEPRYTGEPIKILQTNNHGTTVTQVGFNSWDNQDFPDFLAIPTDEIIATMVNNGTYVIPPPTADPDTQRTIDPPPPLDQPAEPIIPPSLIPQAPPRFEPPIIQGQTQPINPITGDDIEVDTLERNINRYEQYFYENQRQYEPFRNMFRDILPIVTGFAGGYFAFSYQRSRDRGTIGEILQNERVFLQDVETRITSARIDLGRPLRPDDPGTQITLTRVGDDISDTPLKDLQPILQNRRDDLLDLQAQLPPDTAFGLRGTPQYQFNEPERARITQELNDIEYLVGEAQTELNTLEQDIQQGEITRPQINQRIDNLINLDTRILQNIYIYKHQILTGLQIGTTLGLVLSGYFFPTYVDIEDKTKFNTEYDKSEEPTNKAKNLLHDPVKVINDVSSIEPKNIKSRIQKPVERNFIPVKTNRGKPLSYKEIQELKATLSSSELNNLKGKYLIFGNDNRPNVEIKDNCKSIIGETQIFKRPIKSR